MIGGAVGTTAYLESARRLGTIPWLVGDGAVLGSGGSLAAATHFAGTVGLALVGVEVELAVIAAGDAFFANQGCH
jgi:hypothetical protein